MANRRGLQLHLCNAGLILFGGAAIVLLFIQLIAFGSRPNYQTDIRILYYFHAITGVLGLFYSNKNSIGVILRPFYAISFILSLSTGVSFVWTTVKIVLLRSSHTIPEEVVISTRPLFVDNFLQTSVINCILCAIALLTAFCALFGFVFTDGAETDGDMAIMKPANSGRPIMLAAAKLLLAFCAMLLTIFIQYEYQIINPGKDISLGFSLDLVTITMIVVTSLLELQINSKSTVCTSDKMLCTVLLIYSTVWCAKSIDNNMFPYLKEALATYRTTKSLSEITFAVQLMIPRRSWAIIATCCTVAIFTLLLFLTAVGIVECVNTGGDKVRRKRLPQERLLIAINVIWFVFLFLLTITGYSNIPWNGDFIGGDLFWLAAILIGTSIVFLARNRAMLHAKYVLAVICCSVASEKMCCSLNLVYQSVYHSSYTNEKVTDQRTFMAQIILYSIQLFILLGITITSIGACLLYARALPPTVRRPNVLHFICVISSLAYGIIFTSCLVLFEVGTWKYFEVPIEDPFYRLANGPFAVFVFIVQISAFILPQLIISAIILQIILSSLALFVIGPTVANLFYLNSYVSIRRTVGFNSLGQSMLSVEIILCMLAVFSCILCTICAILSVKSYKIRSKTSNEMPISILKLNGTPSPNVQAVVPSPVSSCSDPSEHQLPFAHQITIHPIEEQTLYWSADENPYIYKSTKRFYYDDSAYHSSYASPVTANDEELVLNDLLTTLEKPPRSGGNSVISKTRIAYPTSNEDIK